MHDFQEHCQTVVRACDDQDGVFVDFFLFKTMYNKTIIRFGVCDMQLSQGLGKCYKYWYSARSIRPTSK